MGHTSTGEAASARARPGPVVGDLADLLVLGPAEVGGDQAGDLGGGVGGRVAGEDAGAGAAGQDVVDGAGHLVAGGVDGLGPEVGQAGDERLAQRRAFSIMASTTRASPP